MLGDSFPLLIWISLDSLFRHWYIHASVFLNLHAMNVRITRIQTSIIQIKTNTNKQSYTTGPGIKAPHATCCFNLNITCHSIFWRNLRPTPGRGNFLEASVAFPLQQRREEVIGVKGLWWWSPIWIGRRFQVGSHAWFLWGFTWLKYHNLGGWLAICQLRDWKNARK